MLWCICNKYDINLYQFGFTSIYTCVAPLYVSIFPTESLTLLEEISSYLVLTFITPLIYACKNCPIDFKLTMMIPVTESQ